MQQSPFQGLCANGSALRVVVELVLLPTLPPLEAAPLPLRHKSTAVGRLQVREPLPEIHCTKTRLLISGPTTTRKPPDHCHSIWSPAGSSKQAERISGHATPVRHCCGEYNKEGEHVGSLMGSRMASGIAHQLL